MPKLTIDSQVCEVASGTTVLEAAKSLGIWIPHFCYHPALGSVGACRLCAVKLLDGPIKGVQMSCMLPAQDGMVVSTTDPEALRMRQMVIEWLMLNHPHDCPVCDEGGECLLQDYTIAGGHGIRRYRGKKRTHLNQYLGPYIEHEMNRCIQCYRCVRFYQDYAGGRDFGVMGSAARVYYGRFGDGELESPFSGNLVDICPTGVFTDKTARFRARYWDYEMAPSICPHCSLGCNTVPAARYRELLKTMARRNPLVNDWFICDRGRFNNSMVNDPSRPRVPMVDGKEVPWDDALGTLVIRIEEMLDLHGPGSLAIVGSPRLTLEGALLLRQLAEMLGAPLCYFNDEEERSRSMAAAALLVNKKRASMADVRGSDCIAIFGTDLREEGPMMLLAVRQAWRKGAPVFLVGAHAPLEQGAAIAIEPIQLSYLEEVPFGIFDNPVIICGTKLTTTAEIEQLHLADAEIACLFHAPNSFGAALLSVEHDGISLSKASATGKVKGVIAIEADIPAELLEGVVLLAALDWKDSAATKAAQVLLPTTAWVEMDGTFVNNEGRAQRFQRVMQPGIPIKANDPAQHPPRIHRKLPPGGNLRPAWQIIAELIERVGGERIANPLDGRWSGLVALDPNGEGVKITEIIQK